MQIGNRARTGTLPVTIAVLAILALAPLISPPVALVIALTYGMLYGIAAVGLDVYLGYAGQLSFGNFGFVLVGAYVGSMSSEVWHLNPWLGVALSTLIAGAIAVLVGLPLVRLPALGGGLVTFFFATAIVALLSTPLLSNWTGGASGVSSKALSIGGLGLNAGWGAYYLTLLALLLAALAATRYVSTPAGMVLRLVKRSEIVASTLGVNVWLAKLTAFFFSGLCGGLAGAIFGQMLGYLVPTSFSSTESLYLVVMTVVGGTGTIVGPIIGAVVFMLLSVDILKSAGTASEILFAVALLASLVLAPSGLFGLVGPSVSWIRKRSRRARRHHAIEYELSPGPRETEESPAAPQVTMPAPDLKPETANRDMLRVTELSVAYGGVKALTDVTATFDRGAVYAVIGPNGAGKTTMFNCITGLQACTGTIHFDSELISGRSPQAIRRLGISRTFQNPSLVHDLTAEQNVQLGAWGLMGISPVAGLVPSPAARRRALSARESAQSSLELVGMSRARSTLQAGDLSLAEQKLVDIARAIAAKPRLLLLDEPTAGLRPEEMERLVGVVMAIQATGVTVLIVSHHIGYLRSVTNGVIVLDLGKVIGAGEFDEVLSRHDVASAFLGQGDVR